MLRVLGSLVAAAAVLLPQVGERPPVRLKPGDTVRVTTPYGGDFTVQSDGAVYGRGFRAVLEGKTVMEAQEAMRKAMSPFVRESDVVLTVLELRDDVVYIVGLGGGRGPVTLRPDQTLRQVLASTDLGADADRVDATLYRDGAKVVTTNVAALLSGGSDQVLKANDVVTLSPAPFVRVWVLGHVANPGEIKVPEGSDAFQALAAAGGFAGGDPSMHDTASMTVRRGPQTFEFSLRETQKKFAVESGDTITVSLPEAVRVTVLGEVNTPGEYVLKGDKSLLSAVALAGGPNTIGTMGGIAVFRQGEIYQVDSTMTCAGAKPFALGAGDVVIVQRNERAFYVLGEVAGPGKFLIKDGETLRVTDALAAAGGLSGRGTMRRVYLARPGSDGKVGVQMFHLDDFIKDGDQGANPEIKPGDTLLFGQPKGITIGNVTQAISAALLFENLIKK